MIGGLAGALALLAPAAHAGSGTGGATASPAPTPAPGAGAVAAPLPASRKVKLTRVACVSGCAGAGAIRPGGVLRVRGTGLMRALEVDFGGAPGPDDDVAAVPAIRRKTSVDVRVPLGAVTGTVAVVDPDGLPSRPLAAPLTVAPAPAPAGGPSIEVDARAPRAFFDGTTPIRASYVVHDDRPVTVQAQVVRLADGAVVASWSPGTVQPETPQTLEWDGLAAGQLGRAGRYAFRVSAADEAGTVRATSAQAGPGSAPGDAAPGDPSEFTFLRNQFPVRGPHNYGGAVARFGGARGHQGQDVFATCGTPLVAARGGTVKFRAFQSRAGNYLVIDGARTGVDYAYMHLRAPALVARGQVVRTGQLIGYVGDTGDADGCHLHLEMWTKPGWYTGGSPFDPLPSLQAWDRSS
jgi:murein DD-endopeptidase MepM/ murein hydrolase activator NlpD